MAKLPHRFWTEEERRFVRENISKIPLQEIATSINRTYLALETFCKTDGLKTPLQRRFNLPFKPPEGGAAFIPLSGKHAEGKFAKVDAEDYEFLMQWGWHLEHGYAVRNASGSRASRPGRVMMHRVIAKTPEGVFTDHVNFDKLDNRKSNLRHCNKSENSQNRAKPRRSSNSIYKGAFLDKRSGRWVARIGYQGKYIYLGTYSTDLEAAKAYDEAARKYFGEFACVNFS